MNDSLAQPRVRVWLEDAALNDIHSRIAADDFLSMSTSSGCMDSSSTHWMVNSGGETPCQVLERVVRVCNANAHVPNLSVDASCASLGTNSTSPCCCSTVTFALVSACWVCQTNRPPSQLSSTYHSWWSACPVDARLNGSLPAIVSSQSPPITIPSWALVRPAEGDANWNQSSAQLAVGITSSSTTGSSTSSAPSTTASATTSPNQSKPNHPPYTPIAVCSALAVLLLLGMAAWLYRRRNRISPSSRPPPDFEIDGGPSSGLLPQENPRRPTWTWWRKRTSSSRQSVSDPGKIDAWRYPFDYEPVSTAHSSGSATSGRGQYYDPHRPRRNSDVLYRNSMDTLGLRGQASNATLGQNYPTPGYSSSSQNLVYGRATPSPVPGHMTPIQTYTTLPQQGVNHPSFTYTQQPPTYTYTYPYAQPQPVPSTSTTSPLSPQHIQSPSRTAAHRRGDQMVIIPTDQMSPAQIEQLRQQFPDLRIKRKKPRRREGQADTRRGHGVETDREDRAQGQGRERGRARASTDAEMLQPVGMTRTRSMSVPAQVETDEEWDGRPRNAVELREKYERRREPVVTITVEGGGGGAGGGGGGGGGPARRESVTVRTGAGVTIRPASGDGKRNSRSRGRAQDGGVRLMGGPPPIR
ncbi:hypothetical protein OPQ81_002210 [Rhizoctonia solani]|nr:hypothetical protein OPQ81_002210 [Rhizoctonia solani]